MRQKLRYLSLLSLGLISCASITVKDAITCSTAGLVSEGAVCSHTNSASTHDLSMEELLDMMTPQQERTCVPVSGMSVCSDDQSHGTPVLLPARAAGIIMSAAEWGEKKTELEEACRELKSSCTYEQTLK